MRVLAISLAVGALLAFASAAHADKPSTSEGRESAGDPRRFTHGIGAAKGLHQNVYVFYSRSSLSADAKDSNAPWSHDIYVAVWDADADQLGPSRKFIGEPEAQEPVSVAQNASGTIMLTMEDGWNTDHGVTQRYGVYNKRLEPVRPYPVEVEPGGHSGHIAAVGDFFIVTYSDGWVDSGGHDDLGSGNGVYAKVYDASGAELHDINIVHAQRAWWPVVAGGNANAMVAWQQLVDPRKPPQLNVALIDPASGRLGPPIRLHEALQYYTYSITCLTATERYLILGTAHDGHGFARLIDSKGRITASLDGLPATIREAGIAVQDGHSATAATYAYIPVTDGQLMQLRIDSDSLSLSGLLEPSEGKTVRWHPVGSLGLFTSRGTLNWLSLTPQGLEQIRFDPVAQGRAGETPSIT